MPGVWLMQVCRSRVEIGLQLSTAVVSILLAVTGINQALRALSLVLVRQDVPAQMPVRHRVTLEVLRAPEFMFLLHHSSLPSYNQPMGRFLN